MLAEDGEGRDGVELVGDSSVYLSPVRSLSEEEAERLSTKLGLAADADVDVDAALEKDGSGVEVGRSRPIEVKTMYWPIRFGAELASGSAIGVIEAEGISVAVKSSVGIELGPDVEEGAFEKFESRVEEVVVVCVEASGELECPWSWTFASVSLTLVLPRPLPRCSGKGSCNSPIPTPLATTPLKNSINACTSPKLNSPNSPSSLPSPPASLSKAASISVQEELAHTGLRIPRKVRSQPTSAAFPVM